MCFQVTNLEMTDEKQSGLLTFKSNRYKILATYRDVKISSGEYINELRLDNVGEDDNGTYICLVAVNGIDSLTFKSANLHVKGIPINKNREIHSSPSEAKRIFS